MAAPPKVTIGPPPKKPKGPPNQNQTLAGLLKYAPAWKQYVPLIKNAAQAWGVDPAFLLAVLIWENTSADPNARSSKGAVGLAQIWDKSVNAKLNPTQFQAFQAQFPKFDPSDPAFAVNYLAWRMAGSIRQYGSLDSWYASNYNPGFQGDARGTGPQSLFYKAKVGGYQGSLPLSPTQQAGKTVSQAQANQGVVSPWAVITPQGGVKFVRSVQPPKGALRDALGNPIDQGTYISTARGLDTIYLAYTGARTTPGAVRNYLKNPVSEYELTMRLTNPQLNPRFYKSPIWTTNAPRYEAYYKSIYGPDAKPPKDLLTYGIVHNMDATAFTQYLKDRPDYVNSQDFKQQAAGYRAQYAQIYGTPDPAGEGAITQAVKKGLSGDQWAAYLRSQPEYTGSGEFHRNVYALFNNMGLIQGGQTELQAPAPQAPTPEVPLNG